MSKVHITRKELRHDEVKDAGRSALHYLDVHRTKMLTGALVVLAVLLALRVGASMVASRRAETARDLALARSYYVQASRLTDQASFDNRLDMALPIVNRLVEEYGTSPASLEALYVKGSCLYLKQDFDGAMAAFQECADKSADQTMKAEGSLALAYCLDSKAFLDPSNADLKSKARKAFEKARDLGSGAKGTLSYVSADAMMNLAEMAADEGKYDEAMKIYQTVADSRSMSKDTERFKTKSEEKKEGKQKEGEERIGMIREGVRESLAQFSFQQAAERRLAQLKARVQASAAPETKSE